MNTIAKHFTYGFRDQDTLGPANFVTTYEELQVCVMEGNMVQAVYALQIHKDQTFEKALARVKRIVKKNHDLAIKRKDISPVFSEGFYR